MKSLLFLVLLATFMPGCKKAFDHYNPDKDKDNNYKGFLYTSTNATDGNAIIALGRHRDGTVEELKGSPYHTGSRGDAAEGDFDTQWALRIVGDYLLAVNAGANPVNGTISVFKINKANGYLEQIDQDPTTPIMNNKDSRGVRAASIAAKTIGGKTWVIVGNQFANPNYQGSPAVAFGSVMSTPDRNLAVFTLDQASGLLSYEKIGATYMNGNFGGPTTVEFNAAGTKIAVSTWGVPHFAAPDADLKLQKPGRLYIYDFSEGNLSQTGMFEEEGISGNIGFSWSPNDKYIYLSNFNLHSSKEANSLTVHDETGAKVQHFATAGRNDEGCWTWVSIDKQKLYVASFGENVVSAFSILGNNLLEKTLEPNFFKRRGQIPPGDTKDMHETSDGYLYVSGAFQSHTLTTFKTSASGKLSEVTGSPYYVPTSQGKSKEEHAYLGLTGIDKNDSDKY
jgi:6-phosphogluconolactonase (cycloisomerase 2 family)